MNKWAFDWVSIGMVISYTTFFMSSFTSWNDHQVSMALSKQSIEQTKFETAQTKNEMAQRNSAFIAADNLPRAAETFQLSTRLESHDFPADKMIQLKAWKELKTTLAGYAERTKMLEEKLSLQSNFYRDQQKGYSSLELQISKYMLRMSYVQLACLLAVIVFSMMQLSRKKEKKTDKPNCLGEERG